MAKDPYPSDTQDKFMLRLPEGMRERIRAAAEANRRSMNAEIVDRLAESFTAEERDQHRFIDHIESLDAFMKASPERRDVLAITMLEHVELLRSLSDQLRKLMDKDTQS